MNAVEQMMQAFSATSHQQLSALLGIAPTGQSEPTELALDFASFLQESGATLVSDVTGFHLVTPDVANASALTSTEELPNILAGVSEQSDIDLSSFITDPEALQAIQEGIPGLQLVQLSGLDINTLVQSGQLVPDTLNANTVQSQTVTENDIFLFAASADPSSDKIHLLPVAQLEAIITDSAAKASATPAALPSSAPVAPTVENIPNAPATTETPVSTATATATAPETGIPAAQPVTDTEAAKQQVAAAAQDPVTKTAAPQVAAAQQQSAAQTGKFDQPVQEDTAEGHAVAANPAAKKVAQQNAASANNQNAPATQQAAATAAQAAATAAQAANAQASASAPKATKSIETDSLDPTKGNKATSASQVTASTNARTQPLPLYTTTWTPEFMAGAGEGSAADALAAGLSGLRGEGSFMGSMGLIGGKPTASMGGQLAKQLNLNISKALKNGESQFSMRMDPPELGRVNVKLAFGLDGLVTARVAAERPETLELLQREVRSLERAIEAGGHKAADGGIQFSLDTGDGESAGKAFAKAMQEDLAAENGRATDSSEDEAPSDGFEELDEETLNEVLAQVTPETGLDVRV